MQTALIKAGVEFGKAVGLFAVTFTGVLVGLHIAEKVAPPINTGIDTVTSAVGGVVIGARTRVGALLSKKEKKETTGPVVADQAPLAQASA